MTSETKQPYSLRMKKKKTHVEVRSLSLDWFSSILTFFLLHICLFDCCYLLFSFFRFFKFILIIMQLNAVLESSLSCPHDIFLYTQNHI